MPRNGPTDDSASASPPYVVVVSEPDVASVTIGRALHDAASWERIGSFGGRDVLRYGRLILCKIEDLHIYHERLDLGFRTETGIVPAAFMFASRHQAASRKHTLTVHPIGNFAEAKYGGKPWTLAPAPAALQSKALRLLMKNAAGLPYDVSFEATHHGPEMRAPSFFIEVGSSEERWGDEEAAAAVARTIMGLGEETAGMDLPTCLGVGGGHYSPRPTDAVRLGRANIGHMLARHHLESDPVRALTLAAELTGSRRAVVDPRDLPSEAVSAMDVLGITPL